MKISKQKRLLFDNYELEVVEIVHENGITISSEQISDHLLFAILEKLEEVRCGLIDVEDAVNKLNPAFYLTRKIGG